MGTTLSKDQLVSELKQENADWQALLDDIGETNMIQPEVAGSWSIKDYCRALNRMAAQDSKTTPGTAES